MRKSLGTKIIVPSQTTSAIPIVNPDEEAPAKVVIKPPSRGNVNNKPLCRNVIIHGFCKYEGKGCEFNHDSNKTTSTSTSPENKNKSRNTLILNSVSVDSINAPEFVPRSTTDTPNKDSPINKNTHQPETPTLTSITNGFSQFGVTDKQTPTSPPQVLNSYMYVNQPPLFPRQPLQHHLYSQPLPHVSNLQPHQRTIQDFFIPDNIREQMTQRNEAQLLTASSHELGLPLEVHVYHSLFPLEPQNPTPSTYYGHPSSVYKATSGVDGRQYVLVRIEGYRLVNELSMQVVEAWRHIRHCNIISIREAFTTRAFGDSSLVFVYDYHPCSTTLYSMYFTPQGLSTLGNPRIISESVIWSHITQIASALKAVHGSGLAARNIDHKKILMTGKNRVRLSGSAILDVLQYDDGLNVPRQQQEDLLSFGKFILDLACVNTSATDLQQLLEHVTKCYSPDLKKVILYLLGNPSPSKTIDEVIVMISPHILDEINHSQYYNDVLENEISRELENGRLVRLMCKMGFINERPEFQMDPGWSETGDRYLIKLFRDYVFHQVDEKGKPVIDMAHVITCLNKLDAGVDEKIMLISRDEQSCLIVSFKEVKNCINSAFNDLSSGQK